MCPGPIFYLKTLWKNLHLVLGNKIPCFFCFYLPGSQLQSFFRNPGFFFFFLDSGSFTNYTFFLSGYLNKFKVHNKDTLYKLVEKRKPGQPLITVSNHYSCLDDPIMWGELNVQILLKLFTGDYCRSTQLHV